MLATKKIPDPPPSNERIFDSLRARICQLEEENVRLRKAVAALAGLVEAPGKEEQ